MVYQAEVTDAVGEKKVYVGSTGNTFKERLCTHTATLKKERPPEGDSLIESLLEEKDGVQQGSNGYDGKSSKTNATVSERAGCTVCNLERLAIASVSPDVGLNVRNELVTACLHFTKKYFIKPKKHKQNWLP